MESHNKNANGSESQTSIEPLEFFQSVRKGQELMHKLHQEGLGNTTEYQQLSNLLISPDGVTWKAPHEIPEGLLLGTLESIEQKEVHDNANPEAKGEDLESFLEQYSIGMLDRTMPIPRTAEGRAAIVDELRSLDPSMPIKMYHGLNGSLGKALDVITSPAEGVEQRSGPTLALWPVMQFWKPGDAGFEYELKRGDVQFPGEHNPNAIAEIREDGVIYLINDHSTLPLKNFNGRVLYTDVRGEDTDPGYDAWGIELPRWTGYRPLSEKDVAHAQEISKRLHPDE